MALRSVGEHPAEQRARSHSEQPSRERRRGHRERRAVERRDHRHPEGLEAHPRRREQHEVSEGEQHGRHEQHAHIGQERRRGHRVARGRAMIRQPARLARDHDPDDEGQGAHGHQRLPPPEERGEGEHRRRRRGPAQAAENAVDAVRASETPGVQHAVEDRVVRRVKDGVAEPGHEREADEHRVGRAQPHERDAGGIDGESREEHAPGADAVDEEARRGLPHAGGRSFCCEQIE